MMRWGEAVVFLALAATVHAGLWLAAPSLTGSSATGGPGQPQATLGAASPAQAALVRQWTRPPETAEAPVPGTPGEADATPATPRPVPPSPRLAPAPGLPALAPAALPRADRTPPARPAPPRAEAPRAPTRPQAPARTTRPAPSGPETPEAPTRSQPRLAAPAPEATPRADTAPPARPDPPRPAAREARDAQPASPPSAPAAGGGTARARAIGGESGTARTQSRETANAPALIAGWGAKIQRKVHRRVLTPRGVAGSGTVRIALTVGRDGALHGVRVTRSSGIAAFDRAAVDAVRRAGRFPAAPDGLTRARYDFALALNFRG